MKLSKLSKTQKELWDLAEWLKELSLKLNPERIYVNTEDPIIGYFWNARKRYLHFISKKEAEKLDKKHMVWKHIGEDWNETKTS